MKTMKNLSFLFVFAVLAITFSNCSKSGDPTPTQAQKTALDSVKAAMTGTWAFQSLTLKQIATGKTQVLSCDVSSSYTSTMNTFYGNSNWIHYRLEFNWAYGGTTNVTGTNYCVSGATASYTITAVQNADKSVDITFDAGGSSLQTYNVKSKNITPTSIIATFVKSKSNVALTEGYLPTMIFKRQ